MGKRPAAIELSDRYAVGTSRAAAPFPGFGKDHAARWFSGAESRLRSAVLEATDEGILIIDGEGRLIDWSASATRILGIDLHAGAGASEWWELLAVRDAISGEKLDISRHVISSAREARDVPLKIDREGVETSLSVNCLPLRDETGSVDGFVLSFRDVSDRECERRELLESQERLREAHDVAKLASWEWNPENGDVVVFQALQESGMKPGEKVTLDQWLALIPADQQQCSRDDLAAFSSGERDESVRRFAHVLPSGSIWLEIRSRAIRDVDGALRCVRGTAQDVSEQELARQELAGTRDFLQATLDSLPTQVAVLDERGEIIMTNDAWTQFALENDGAATCVGVGANYLAVCDEDETDATASRAAVGLRAIIAGTQTEFSMEYEHTGLRANHWFQMNATTYLGAGPARVVVTHENISERKAEEQLVAIDLDKLAWVAQIEAALSNDRFVLHAQPILELATGRIAQHELLIRLRHPQGSDEPGLVAPGYFLPAAEEFGLITQIDRWVVDRAAELAATGLPVELNVSGRSISDPRLVDYIQGAIERTGANPASMVFEITETTLVEDDASARAFVARLHGLGCKIALDDFGTGYGGFTYLKQLPIDYLKIDIEFVTDLLYNPSSRTVVQAIVRLAQGFGLQTVAEGVENGDTMEALRQLGVDYVQGYHIGRPAALPPGQPLGEVRR